MSTYTFESDGYDSYLTFTVEANSNEHAWELLEQSLQAIELLGFGGINADNFSLTNAY